MAGIFETADHCVILLAAASYHDHQVQLKHSFEVEATLSFSSPHCVPPKQWTWVQQRRQLFCGFLVPAHDAGVGYLNSNDVTTHSINAPRRNVPSVNSCRRITHARATSQFAVPYIFVALSRKRTSGSSTGVSGDGFLVPRSSIRKIRAGESGGGESGGGESSGGESSGGGESEGGGGGSEGGGSEGEGEGRSGLSGQEGESSSISSGGTTKSITTYNKGGEKATSISSGLFAVRMQGGGTRDEIWGSRTYGSSYPGSFARGVDNKGFPFYFWPISWGNGTASVRNALDMSTGEGTSHLTPQPQ
ncbi:hypothetical protein B0H14DRAFT_2582091 [Mycena olivaceomarginata]|nr:hypothetical protein B0H14DRAFT_2582091 [Mycena olivaceomarginata]